MWYDDNTGGDRQDIFGEPPQIMAPMPEINDDKKPETKEIELEQERAIDAIVEQQAIVAE